MSELRHIISLGAGVQSSTMLLMAMAGEIEPMPELAIFADTGWEPREVYEWLEYLEGISTIPIVRVQHGNIRDDNVIARDRGQKVNGQRWASLPYFTKEKGAAREGRVRRQCTSEYKIQPIENYLKRVVLGIPKGKRLPVEPVICQWRGISADEAQRMKPSRAKWMVVRYPLAMEHRMMRADCLAWMIRHGDLQPPRSACVGCPFHSDHEWRRMKQENPEGWFDAVDFDKKIRKAGGMRGDTFLHRSCVPLDEVDFSTAEDRGQFSLWGNECEGMCGI